MVSASALYQREYRRTHRAEINLKKKEYRLKHPEIDSIKYLEGKDTVYPRSLEWKRDNPDRVKLIRRRSNLKKKYGISLEDYEALLLVQNNSCVLCLRHQNSFQTRLVVDHDHTTGKVRGLLCNDCNRNLIADRNDPEIFIRAAEYIRKSR